MRMITSDPVVLVAEDNDNDAQMLRRAFQQAGLVVPLYVVSDGDEAVEYLQGSGRYANRKRFPVPDLLLLDLKMPRKDGFQVIEWVRKQPSLAPLRIVVLTSSDEIRDVNQAYRLGANSFLVKPLDFTDFKNTIHDILTYWRANRAPEVSRPPAATADLSAAQRSAPG
jgi:CheY-like chemotaxis protein